MSLIEDAKQRDKWLGWELDKVEKQHDEALEELKAATQERLGKIERRLTQLVVTAAGLLVSTTTIALTLLLTGIVQ